MSLGIHAVRFNRFIPTLNTYLNYRNHRKMTIIDAMSVIWAVSIWRMSISTKRYASATGRTPASWLRGEGTANMTALFLQM